MTELIPHVRVQKNSFIIKAAPGYMKNTKVLLTLPVDIINLNPTL
jgi:hypothetical protein